MLFCSFCLLCRLCCLVSFGSLASSCLLFVRSLRCSLCCWLCVAVSVGLVVLCCFGSSALLVVVSLAVVLVFVVSGSVLFSASCSCSGVSALVVLPLRCSVGCCFCFSSAAGGLSSWCLFFRPCGLSCPLFLTVGNFFALIQKKNICKNQESENEQNFLHMAKHKFILKKIFWRALRGWGFFPTIFLKFNRVFIPYGERKKFFLMTDEPMTAAKIFR